MDKTLLFHFRCRAVVGPCKYCGNETIALKSRGGVTVVLDRTSGKLAMAFCSLADNYNKNTGRAKAQYRLANFDTCNGTGQIVMPDNEKDLREITNRVQAAVLAYTKRYHRKLYRQLR